MYVVIVISVVVLFLSNGTIYLFRMFCFRLTFYEIQFQNATTKTTTNFILQLIKLKMTRINLMVSFERQ